MPKKQKKKTNKGSTQKKKQIKRIKYKTKNGLEEKNKKSKEEKV